MQRTDEALQYLESAAAGFDTAGMRMHAAVARRHQGILVGGDRGRSIKALGDGYAERQSIVNLRAWAAMLAPGFPDD